jgi:predicted amidophosphoribosyltransferase
MNPADGTWACGRYFQGADVVNMRCDAPLSRLMLQAKNDPVAGAAAAEIFAAAALAPQWAQARPTRICSVPPKPTEDGTGVEPDRFDVVRPVVAAAFGARDGVGALRMTRRIDDYKRLNHDARRAANQGRFDVTADVAGEHILLLDDVYTSGGQTNVCREKLVQAGAARVDVLAAATDPADRFSPAPTGRGPAVSTHEARVPVPVRQPNESRLIKEPWPRG